MQEIIEICKAVPLSRLRYSHLIGQSGDKADELFYLVQSGKIKEKKEALNALYPGDKYPNEAFWHLKQKLIDRVTNTIISLHDNEESEILAEFRMLQKKCHAYKLLRAKGQRQAALWIGERAIKKSIKFDFTEITLSLARELARYFASVKVDKRKYQHYKQLMIRYQELANQEMEIEDCFNEVVFHFTNRKYHDDSFIAMVREKVEIVKSILSAPTSFRNILLGYNVITYYYNLVKDDKGLLEACEDAIQRMEALPYKPPYTSVFSFLIKTLPINIQNGRYDTAQETINKCQNLVPIDSHNWMVTQQYQVILNFYREAYRKNLKLVREIKNKHTKTIQNHIEVWRLYEAYACFMTGEKIRLGKFLNEVPKFSKDKRGMNINILILQILFLLQEGKTNEIIDRMDALERYSYRYLRKDQTFRSNCFIHMLLQLEKGYFNRKAVERKAKRFTDRLQSVPFGKSRQDIEVEIIPYERLWKMILELID